MAARKRKQPKSESTLAIERADSRRTAPERAGPNRILPSGRACLLGTGRCPPRFLCIPPVQGEVPRALRRRRHSVRSYIDRASGEKRYRPLPECLHSPPWQITPLAAVSPHRGRPPWRGEAAAAASPLRRQVETMVGDGIQGAGGGNRRRGSRARARSSRATGLAIAARDGFWHVVGTLSIAGLDGARRSRRVRKSTGLPATPDIRAAAETLRSCAEHGQPTCRFRRWE